MKKELFIPETDPKKHPANIGLDFTFDGYITEQVLKNYLSRSMYLSLFDGSTISLHEETRMMFNIGAKYISRATLPWTVGAFEEELFENCKSQIEQIHTIDSDIILEACIFETTCKGVEEIEIPDTVFKAFHLTPIKRNFSYQDMLFSNGRHLNQLGADISVPDITKLETQLFLFYRGCYFIDMGFEGLHWGQIHLVSENDSSFANYEKVLSMVRDYAKTHARRHFVLNNAATNGVIGPSGKLLMDLHNGPTRLHPAENETSHAATLTNPQKTILEKGHCGVLFGNSLGGMTYSGWSCQSLPYFVEIDNCGGIYSKDTINQPDIDYWPWGFDEGSWLVNQSDAYRSEWLYYAYNWVKNNDPAGFFKMPGNVPATILDENAPDGYVFGWYRANNEQLSGYGNGDEDVFKEIWIADNK